MPTAGAELIDEDLIGSAGSEHFFLIDDVVCFFLRYKNKTKQITNNTCFGFNKSTNRLVSW